MSRITKCLSRRFEKFHESRITLRPAKGEWPQSSYGLQQSKGYFKIVQCWKIVHHHKKNSKVDLRFFCPMKMSISVILLANVRIMTQGIPLCLLVGPVLQGCKLFIIVKAWSCWSFGQGRVCFCACDAFNARHATCIGCTSQRVAQQHKSQENNVNHASPWCSFKFATCLNNSCVWHTP